MRAIDYALREAWASLWRGGRSTAFAVIAIALAFPSLKSWHKSFMFRVRRGGYALTFDLHRSGGAWAWGLLMVVALTSIAMNLTNPVMRPLVSLFSPLGSTPFSDPALAMPPSPTSSPLSRERVVALARVAARRDGIDAPPGAGEPWRHGRDEITLEPFE